MKTKYYYYGLVFTIILQNVLAYPQKTDNEQFSHEKIIDSTWSLYCWKVLGWQYDAQLWSKGSKETAQVGQSGQTYRDRNIRAVCLGKEKGHYVFFTLKSFVDPSFPNPYLQGIENPPLKTTGKPFSVSEVAKEKYVRYGGITLVRYEDKGGGTYTVDKKIQTVIDFDEKVPKSYGRSAFSKRLNPDYYENINGVMYERPHEVISASEHLKFQEMTVVKIKKIEDHDVALIYLPQSLVQESRVSNLEIENPTLTVRMALEQNVKLFGFRFILIGQETLDLIRQYAPQKNAQEYKGFMKFISVTGLALGPETFFMLDKLDEQLDLILPDEVSEFKSREQLVTWLWDRAGTSIKQIVNDKERLALLRKNFMYTLHNSLK